MSKTLRALSLALFTVALVAGLATAEPSVTVSDHDGVPQIVLEGQYPQSSYTVSRASSSTGIFEAITASDVLCLGPCFADDRDAVPGETYWYRFDLVLADGQPLSFGPYRVALAAPSPRPMDAWVFPNPSRGAASINVYLRGARSDAPLDVQISILDLQGRRIRELAPGPLARGVTTLRWDGRDQDGARVGSGHYFLRLSSALGTRVARITRVR